MPDREDENQQAVRQVEGATDSEPVNGEDLLESEELKRRLREVKTASDTAQKTQLVCGFSGAEPRPS